MRVKIDGFYKSASSKMTYRYNQLFRVFYKKGSSKLEKEMIKEKLLWENIALVLYDDTNIIKGVEVI